MNPDREYGSPGRLGSKVAIVTGAGPGIGRSISTFFAREGARVTLVDVDPRAARETGSAINSAGGEALVLESDVRTAREWEAIVARTVDRFGGVDVLVNSAATGEYEAVVEHQESAWDRVMEVNLKSVYLGAQACIPVMIDRSGGSIINIASATAVRAVPALASYIASKSGMLGLTRSIALDYGRLGIRCNAICPGLIASGEKEAGLLADPAEARGARDPYFPGRWGHPDDVAHAAVFLASAESAFVTGITMPVDGGLAAQSPEATTTPSFRRRWRDDEIGFRARSDGA